MDMLIPSPPDEGTETRTRYVVVDSRDRDSVAHPFPNSYDIRLEDDIADVVSMKLVAADVPFSARLVGEHNRRVPVSFEAPGQAGRLIVDALLPPGEYASPADMASTLAISLRDVSSNPAFTVLHAPRTDSFTLECANVPFWLCFDARPRDTAARMLGFAPDLEYASDASGRLTAPFRCDLSPNKYIVMNLAPSADVLSSTNNATNRSFAILPRRFSELSIETDAAVFEKRWTPPLGRFARISVTFTDYDGHPYDFQNQDHVLHLLFTSMRQHRNYRI